MEKLEGEVSFPRENFSFPRSDSCQNRAQRGFGSPDRGKEKFSRGKEEPESFYIEENRFSSRQDIFFLLLSFMTNHKIFSSKLAYNLWMPLAQTSFMDRARASDPNICESDIYNEPIRVTFSSKHRQLRRLRRYSSNWSMTGSSHGVGETISKNANFFN